MIAGLATGLPVLSAQANPFAEAVQDGSLLLSIPVAVLAGLVSYQHPDYDTDQWPPEDRK